MQFLQYKIFRYSRMKNNEKIEKHDKELLYCAFYTFEFFAWFCMYNYYFLNKISYTKL